MAKIVIDIDDKTYKAFMELISINLGRSIYKGIIEKCLNAIKYGKVLLKGQFIAICESDYPITEKVENTLKETAFIGGDEEEEDMYCFDIKEIIKADDDKIVCVGDEIYSELTDSKAVVHHIDAWNRYQCFTDSGSQFILDKHTFNDYWVKTGKNYPQIVEVLKQMRGSET